MLKLLTIAGTAIALAAAPTVAAAQSANAPPPASAGEVQPAAERADGSALESGWVLPLIGVVALIVIILLLTDDDDDELPASP